MIKSKIFLSGGGDARQTFELDKKFFDLLRNNSKILYIPIALKRDMAGFEACSDWFSGIISMHNENKDIDFTMYLEGDPTPYFGEYDAIYIGGGNTFRLLDYLIKSGMKDAILDYLRGKKIVYGGSAGAIIFGKDINTVEEENKSDHIEYEGFDLVNGHSIICHYKDELDTKIFDYVEKNNNQVLAINEESGLIVDEDGVEVVGNVYIFSQGHEKRRFLQDYE